MTCYWMASRWSARRGVQASRVARQLSWFVGGCLLAGADLSASGFDLGRGLLEVSATSSRRPGRLVAVRAAIEGARLVGWPVRGAVRRVSGWRAGEGPEACSGRLGKVAALG